jgi:UDP-glucose 4-epimerase
MSKILVTGGAGFIGTNLVKRLISEGHAVTSLDNYSTGSKSNHVSGVEYINGDISEIQGYSIDDSEYCFHLAAQSRVQPSFENPLKSLEINVTGTTKVMEWARKNKVKVVYAGSASKHYSPSKSPYATTKMLGEMICRLYRESYNVNVEIARFYNVYGPLEPLDEKNGNVLGIWRSKVSKKEPISIVGDGQQKRDFTHVDDIVDGLIKIAQSDESHEDAWELGSGVSYSINQLAELFENHFQANTRYIGEQKGNSRFTLNTNTDAKDRLKWNPKDRLQTYVETL